MIHNETINHQVNHRTIRAFKKQPLNKEQLTTLYEAARHTSTSMFMQQFSILHVTDPQLRTQIREISQQPYVGANGDLFIFIVDLYRNQQIREQEGNDDGRLHTTDIFMQAVEDTTQAHTFSRPPKVWAWVGLSSGPFRIIWKNSSRFLICRR